MSGQIIKKETGDTRQISESYQVTNLITGEVSENVSLAVSEADGHSETTKSIKSDRIYYVLSGKLSVEGESSNHVAQPGDVIFIPSNTKYQFSGSFKAIIINSPPFNPEDEQISEL